MRQGSAIFQPGLSASKAVPQLSRPTDVTHKHRPACTSVSRLASWTDWARLLAARRTLVVRNRPWLLERMLKKRGETFLFRFQAGWRFRGNADIGFSTVGRSDRGRTHFS